MRRNSALPSPSSDATLLASNRVRTPIDDGGVDEAGCVSSRSGSVTSSTSLAHALVCEPSPSSNAHAPEAR